jgi:hypothetical protein
MKSPADGRQYGLLIFYDKSQVSDQQLHSEAFQCSDESLKQVASWHFTRIGEKWTANNFFDYGTEALCSESE